jgi:hypothetical protein
MLPELSTTNSRSTFVQPVSGSGAATSGSCPKSNFGSDPVSSSPTSEPPLEPPSVPTGPPLPVPSVIPPSVGALPPDTEIVPGLTVTDDPPAESRPESSPQAHSTRVTARTVSLMLPPYRP